MNDSEIQLIERELGITLPESYKRALIPFGIKALTGNTDNQLWDNAGKLVELNRGLRAGSRYRPPWPPHLYAIGDPHGDELVAIDTRSPEAPVWWIDHGVLESKATYVSHARFSDWVKEFYETTRADMEADGIDPNGTPAMEKAQRKKGAWEDLAALLLLALLVVGAFAAVGAIRAWFKHR